MKMPLQILKIRSSKAGHRRPHSKNIVYRIDLFFFFSGPNLALLILSEMRAKHAGVEVEISLKMFHLQRQKHFVSGDCFQALSLPAFNCFASEINRIRKIASPFFYKRLYSWLLFCALYRLQRPLFQRCKYIRPQSRLQPRNNPSIGSTQAHGN